MELTELDEKSLLNINGGGSPRDAGRIIGYGLGLIIGSALVAAHIIADTAL